MSESGSLTQMMSACSRSLDAVTVPLPSCRSGFPRDALLRVVRLSSMLSVEPVGRLEPLLIICDRPVPPLMSHRISFPQSWGDWTDSVRLQPESFGGVGTNGNCEMINGDSGIVLRNSITLGNESLPLIGQTADRTCNSISRFCWRDRLLLSRVRITRPTVWSSNAVAPCSGGDRIQVLLSLTWRFLLWIH